MFQQRDFRLDPHLMSSHSARRLSTRGARALRGRRPWRADILWIVSGLSLDTPKKRRSDRNFWASRPAAAAGTRPLPLELARYVPRSPAPEAGASAERSTTWTPPRLLYADA